MKFTLLIIITLTGLTGLQSVSAGEVTAPTTNTSITLDLRDQFGRMQKLSFPTTNITLLTIADKKGSEQVTGWVSATKQRFGEQIDVRGIADVSAVPGPLRSMVAGQFRKSQSYPVMMDWSGAARKAFDAAPGRANVLLLDPRGVVIKRFTGQSTPAALADLNDAILRASVSDQSGAAGSLDCLH
jgi:hypothetical protein